MVLTLDEVAALVGAAKTGGAGKFTRVAVSGNADAETIVFAQDEATLRAAVASKAGLILAHKSAAGVEDARILWVRNPKFAFAMCGKALHEEEDEPLRHPTAVVHPTAKLGERVRLGAHAVIEAHAVLGDDCSIGSSATICRGPILGSRVVVQAGSVLGSTGFGYVRNAETGEWILFPQQGKLAVEDDVEVGANTTIDRGALEETRIGKGTKIDNQVQIAHNCRIGKNVVIAAQTGISGSCTIGDGVVMAGKVGMGEHATVDPYIILGGASAVFPHKKLHGHPGQKFMGVPAEPLNDYLKSLAKVHHLE